MMCSAYISVFDADRFGSNVERLACIWQDLHPGNDRANWLDPTENGGTGGADPTADLWPFHLDRNGRHYKSNDIRDWRPLGYTFPGLEKWLDVFKKNGRFDEQTYMTSIRSQMDKLYSTTARTLLELPRHEAVAKVHLSALSQESQRPVFADLAKSAPRKVISSGSKASTAQQVIAQPKDVNTAVNRPDTATKHPTAGPDSSAPDKWEDNDYIVNVIYEK